jgi:hypothetical protein
MSPDALAALTNKGQSSVQSIWKKLISFPAALATLLVGGMFVPLQKLYVDPDVWWHIKVGDTILSTHHFPTKDIYSFTASGAPWIAYEWLGELLLSSIARMSGLRGLLALDYFLTALILLALFALTSQRCGNSKAAFATCAGLLPLVYLSCSLRPQMLGYLFLILTLLILERFRRGQTWLLWLLPPLFLVWVNTHGSFVIGVVVLGIYLASGLKEFQWGGLVSKGWTPGERLRLEIAALLILVALTITPYGTEICVYPFSMAFAQPINVTNIQEWQAMTFGDLYGKLFLAYLFGFLLAQVTMRPTWRVEELALYFLGVAAACIHIRFVLVFVPFCAASLAVVIARWFPPYDPAKDKYALNAMLMTLVLAGTIAFFPSRAAVQKLMQQNWPVRAVAYLRQHPAPQPMYNTYGYGGYLIWQMAGEYKVFIDGRGDIYERTGALSDYLAIGRLAIAAPFLIKAYNLQSFLVDHDDTVVTLLAASPEWQKVYGDEVSVLYVRKLQPAQMSRTGN